MKSKQKQELVRALECGHTLCTPVRWHWSVKQNGDFNEDRTVLASLFPPVF